MPTFDHLQNHDKLNRSNESPFYYTTPVYSHVGLSETQHFKMDLITLIKII